MTKMTATPMYKKKNLQKYSSLEPKDKLPLALTCSIWDVSPAKFGQMMILGWPCPTLWLGQMCLLMHLNGNKSKAKVIIRTTVLKIKVDLMPKVIHMDCH